MTEYSLADDLSTALALAAEADLISLERFRARDLDVSLKADASHVTDADTRVERVIREHLQAARPGDAILGEEFGTEGESSRQWIVDPIDGTANFMRGVPIWGTLISLVVDGVPQVGVISAPALGRRWWAATGHGAWVRELDREPRRIEVSAISRLDEAAVSYNSFKGWDDAGRLPQLTALNRAVWRSRAIGDLWSYMLVAEGALDAAGELDLKPWDIAALAPIVREAGGRFTSLDGADTIWNGTALASNGRVHDLVLDLVRA
ncbi:inositol monophosphatase family protein [Homoserinibacter sp. YIM 151385]|uniref:inositol monophosphatase family protein n=1 Tax=Homoserinibacter sp. YIM 151385 TaxID=2985506 RepID=UPI0022EFFAD8|nr:inositol monophosphatase family protein [Homoserinibacter sp. YIM 151385]WBU38221.1 histidinol phosphatase [Homoserinibacter sp. YIM 151385]